MSERSKNFILAITGVAMAITLPGGESNDLKAEQPIASVEKNNDPDLEAVHQAVRSFWSEQGVDLGNIDINILELDGQAECSGDMVSGSDPTAFYCPNSKLIIITRAYYDLLSSDLKDLEQLAAIQVFTTAHENGHGVQDVEGRLPEISDDSVDVALKQRLELEADCLAGKAMAALYPSLIEATKAYLSAHDFGIFHNDGHERSYAVELGATTGDCGKVASGG